MLTLMPLNPLQSALKRRNSKSYDYSRRGSLSTYSTYSLPNSKTSMRRFSSYEELAPIFQLFSNSQQQQQQQHQQLTLSESLPVTPQETTTKSSSLKHVRRGSFSLIRRESRSRKTSGDACAALDAQLARIKNKLAQFRNEDQELTHRVDDLASSVQEMYDGRVARPIRHKVAVLKSHKKDRPLSAAVFSREPSPNLQMIVESNSESEDDDTQSYEQYCRTNVPKLGVSSKPKRTPIKYSAAAAAAAATHADTETQKLSINFAALDVSNSSSQEPQEQKKLYFPNNTVRPKVKSAPVLSIVRNDLTKHDFDNSKRLSLISCKSDSVIISHDYHPSRLSFEKTAEAL